MPNIDLTTEVLDAAAAEALGRQLHDIASQLILYARADIRSFGLPEKYVAAALSYATGFAIAEHVADVPALQEVVLIAAGSVKDAAFGRYNDRVDNAKLIRGLGGA